MLGAMHDGVEEKTLRVEGVKPVTATPAGGRAASISVSGSPQWGAVIPVWISTRMPWRATPAR